MKLETAKGVRDFPPEEKIIRDKIVDTLKQVFESYGYNPFEQPIIERLDVLTAKFGAGEESDAYKEIFKFKDQGKRELGLRFELTLSLCRFIAMNPNIKMPFKRYEIGRVYRDGPIKLGRYREFWQCDVDVVGTSSVLADAEIIAIARDVFKNLGFDAVIEVSNRKLLNGILEGAGVSPKLRMPAMISIDKLKKIGIQGVKKELREKGIKQEAIKKIIDILDVKGNNLTKIKKLKKIINNKTGKQGLDELEEIFQYLKSMKVDNAVFNPSLARGLAYYTGPVYEVFLKKSKVTSSVAGGGRYDEFIGSFLGRKTQIPATGISFGLEPITEAIKLRTKEFRKSVSKVYVIPIKTTQEALKVTQELRKTGIKTDIDVIGRGISANLSYANALNIPYVVIVGKEELKKKKVKLRDMKTGKEKLLTLKDLIKFLKK